MTPSNAKIAELVELLALVCDGGLGGAEMERLDALLLDDPALQDYYRRYIVLDVALAWRAAGRPAKECWQPSADHDENPQAAEQNRGATVGEPCEVADSLAVSGASALPLSPSPRFVPVPMSSCLSLSTPLGSFVFSYAAATVILGVGILIAWTCRVSDSGVRRPDFAGPLPPSVQEKDATKRPAHEVVSVARVTDMVDVAWANARLAPSMQRIPLGDTFALASGLVEITYDTGAKVVLQGPCTYTVESRTGGFLERGRLTARVESAVGSRRSAASNTTPTYRTSSSNSLPTADCRLPTFFSVRTPNAVVNDLGTEFGVEVDENKGSCVHVFVGTVDFAPAGKPSGGVRIAAGDARRISTAKNRAVEAIPLDNDRFARPRAMLAGKFRQNQILFSDVFEDFALGTRWRAARVGAPDDVLKAISKDGRTALWMKNKPAENKSGGGAIETIEPFLLQGLAAIQVDVVFQANPDAPASFQVLLVGSTNKALRVFTAPDAPQGVAADVLELDANQDFVKFLARNGSGPDVFQDGRRYRFVVSVTRQGAAVAMKDDVNLAVVHQAKFEQFTLADLGDAAGVRLRLTTRSNQAAECWVYDVAVSGRHSAIHHSSSSEKDIPKPVSQSSLVRPGGTARFASDEKEAAR
jgi:hypothetical protein